MEKDPERNESQSSDPAQPVGSDLPPTADAISVEEVLAQIKSEVAACTKCALHESRKKPVPGEGPADAEIMFIGEGPGFHENEQGRPFMGASGTLLTQLLEQAGLSREDVFICNVVKCRPPENRDPLTDELRACGDYLQRQIDAINPSIIVTLGRISMSRFMPGVKISTVHGEMQKIGDRYVIPMFHPAAALHQAALRPSLLADFTRLPELLKEARRELGREARVSKTPPRPPKPVQLSLF